MAEGERTTEEFTETGRSLRFPDASQPVKTGVTGSSAATDVVVVGASTVVVVDGAVFAETRIERGDQPVWTGTTGSSTAAVVVVDGAAVVVVVGAAVVVGDAFGSTIVTARLPSRVVAPPTPETTERRHTT